MSAFAELANKIFDGRSAAKSDRPLASTRDVCLRQLDFPTQCHFHIPLGEDDVDSANFSTVLSERVASPSVGVTSTLSQ
jgi:hypothetical protein